jgi:hypothetical protein
VTIGNVRRLVWVASAVSIVVLAMSASASAEKAHHPTKEFARFNQCPTENPKTELCTLMEADSGEFQIGNLDIPIAKAVLLQGGLRYSGGTTFEAFEAIPASNGESLVKVPQMLPGGIFGLIKEGRYPQYLRNFCKNLPNNPECKVTATAESIGPPAIDLINLLIGDGTALEIPLRLHLKNPLLGNKCYIGSVSNPVRLAYTTGNEPPLGVEPELKGQTGRTSGSEERDILVVEESKLVDNTFSAPGVEGCGGPQSVIVDREIDEKQGLPAPAGHNRSRLMGTDYFGILEGVLKSEE